MGSLCGDCRGKGVGTLGKIGLAVGRKRFMSVVKPSNSKGSALLGVLNTLSVPSSKDVSITSRSLGGSGGLGRFETRGVNFVFRLRGLVPGVSIIRGVRVPVCARGLSSGSVESHTLGLLSSINLKRGTAVLPGGLSNKRHREMTVTHTLTGSPSVVLTSRPAKSLSSGADDGVLGRLVSLRRSGGMALVVMARSVSMTGLTSEIVRILSNRVVSTNSSSLVGDGVSV